ncbi:efflux RND transporter periplasmic adaptor subunit [Saccharicrinis sp. FJH2]|uniref:efflux RND transporter periplasmic adaptor subunit n=1 Tax=Saccharicrinis sp. FJH65 TaxID=3344659 RepID=UPI0035F27B63
MKQITKNIKENYKLVLGTLIVGLILGWLFFHNNHHQATTQNVTEVHKGHSHAGETTIWTCSMHPQVRSDKPGQCPICGMDLIPLSSLQADETINPNEISMTESAAKLADVQTMTVTRGTPQKTIYLQGKVQVDERNIAELTARYGGRIEKLFINFTGQNVKKGEKLASIYSPELIAAQRELLEAITFKETRPAIYNAAKSKLKLWDLSDEQIKAIEEKGEPQVYFNVLSPISGTVMMRHVALGDYIKEGSPLFRIADLSHLWVVFDAYESDLPWIKDGDEVNFTVQAVPGKTYTGKVNYIDPFINGSTRVAKVRVNVDNKSNALKPEMFVNGTVESEIAASSNDLLIPKTAVLWTGKRSVVYVKVPDRENPTFIYRQIDLGPEAGNFYVVAGGLAEGEEIAVNGVFKIDAAAQLQGATSMMNPDGGDSGAGSMPGMDMGGSKKKSETLSSNNNKIQPDNINPDFKSQLTDVYQAYLKMKDAFVASDPAAVSKDASDVQNAMSKVNMELLKGESHMVWMKQLNVLKEKLSDMIKSNDIEKQRTAFVGFNETFYKTVKTFGLKDVTTYYQFCPMANNDKGAFWFSNSEDIRNPYFGEDMLTCGATEEVLK